MSESDRAPASSLRARHAFALERAAGAARAGEISAGWLDAERSDFVRFNHGRVRQCGTVERARIELRLIARGRQARHGVELSGEASVDRTRIDEGFERLRRSIADADPDPHLSFSDHASRSFEARTARRASIEEICDTVSQAAGGADLVGFYAGGALACALASSAGHDHWHETESWSFEHSVFVAGEAAGDKAVKSTISGADWSTQRVRDSILDAIARSRVLERPARRLEPGRYRCHLDAAAVAELIGMLGWGGFSARAHASGHSPLARLRAGSARFDSRVSFAEDLDALGVPHFQSDGFVRPARIELVGQGRFAQSLVAPRTAREFDLQTNGASASESPQALAMAAGDLDGNDALRRLGTGIAVSDLWYLNFSDREACRVTGMTRFATVWVEDGVPVSPIEVMRFDDSLYRVFGEALEALGASARRMPDTSTYDGRRFGGVIAPGALVEGIRFTL